MGWHRKVLLSQYLPPNGTNWRSRFPLCLLSRRINDPSVLRKRSMDREPECDPHELLPIKLFPCHERRPWRQHVRKLSRSSKIKRSRRFHIIIHEVKRTIESLIKRLNIVLTYYNYVFGPIISAQRELETQTIKLHSKTINNALTFFYFFCSNIIQHLLFAAKSSQFINVTM